MCVEESGTGRPRWDPERLGDLGRGIAQEVVQHENCPLIGRKPTEPTLELVPVGDRKQVVGGSRSVDRQNSKVDGSAPLARRLADAHVDEHAAEPRIEAVRIAEPAQVTPGDHQRLLHGILGPIDVAEDLEGDGEQPIRARTNQVHEGCLVAASRCCHEIAIHSSPLSAPVWRVPGPMVMPGRQAFSLPGRGYVGTVRRIRNLALFAITAVTVAAIAVVALRPVVQRAIGVNVDIGGGGRADLAVPNEYEVLVFAEGLASPRFMAVDADGVLFVAERGAIASSLEVIEVGRGYESAHSVAFEEDGPLLVAGETTLFRVRLGDDLKEAARSVILDGLTSGGHSTRTVAVLRRRPAAIGRVDL
jgi:hypothetical protein